MSILQIPTTRPRSPKLGRNKNSASTTNSSESGGSGLSPRVAKEPDKSPKSNGDKKSTATSTKPVRNLQTETVSQPAVPKTKEKSAATKPKPAKIKSPDQKTDELEQQTGEKSENSPADDNIAAAHSHLTNPVVVVPAQVAVEG